MSLNKSIVCLCVSIFLASALPALASSDRKVLAKVKDSVVKVYSSISAPDYRRPWQNSRPFNSSGSGAIIKGRRVLTNAHVVRNANFIQVQKDADPEKFIARVEFISHDADLALLKIEDERFFKDTVALSIGKLPRHLDDVQVFGYPVGGNTLSTTKGVLSRVEHKQYANAFRYLLAGQIDAAINPGNSGGPVIVDGKIVGVAMQKISSKQTENLGYFIPPSVIKHFLNDIDDGKLHGIPRLGVDIQQMINPGLRKAKNMSGSQSGVYVTKVYPGSFAEGHLAQGDVITHIQGLAIANDATIEFRPSGRTSFTYPIDLLQVGDALSLQVLRNRESLTLKVEVKAQEKFFHTLTKLNPYEERPDYLIFAGLLFVPMSDNLLRSWGRNWYNSIPKHFWEFINKSVDDEVQEKVVLLQIFPSSINVGYESMRNRVVNTLNDVTVKNFKHFVELIEQLSDGEYANIKDHRGNLIVVPVGEARKLENRILQRFNISNSSYKSWSAE